MVAKQKAILFLCPGHAGDSKEPNKKPLERYETKGKYFDHSTRGKNGEIILPIYNGKPVQLHGDGIFLEGVENRVDAALLRNELQPYVDAGKLEIIMVADAVKDTPLAQRVATANEALKRRGNPPSLYYSMHYNAIPVKKPNPPAQAKGIIVFTTPGITRSDTAAEFVIEELLKVFPRWRKDIVNPSPCVRIEEDEKLGMDDEENFYVLRSFVGPAVLIEQGFMTTFSEIAKAMYDLEGYKLPMIKAQAAGIARFLKLN